MLFLPDQWWSKIELPTRFASRQRCEEDRMGERHDDGSLTSGQNHFDWKFGSFSGAGFIKFVSMS